MNAEQQVIDQLQAYKRLKARKKTAGGYFGRTRHAVKCSVRR